MTVESLSVQAYLSLIPSLSTSSAFTHPLPSLPLQTCSHFHISIFLVTGLISGWEDAPLAVEGRNEALFAGQLLKAHGIQVERGAESILVLRPPLQC